MCGFVSLFDWKKVKHFWDIGTLPSDFLISVKYFFASSTSEIITFPGKTKV